MNSKLCSSWPVKALIQSDVMVLLLYCWYLFFWFLWWKWEWLLYRSTGVHRSIFRREKLMWWREGIANDQLFSLWWLTELFDMSFVCNCRRGILLEESKLPSANLRKENICGWVFCTSNCISCGFPRFWGDFGSSLRHFYSNRLNKLALPKEADNRTFLLVVELSGELHLEHKRAQRKKYTQLKRQKGRAK